MDDWAWEQLAPWLDVRVELPVGPLFCVVTGPTRGRPWTAGAARSELRRVAREAGVRRRFAPHQLRHAHAVEMAREGVPLIVIQRQLGHTNLGITSIYLQGIDNAEIIDTVHARRPPMIPSTARCESEPNATGGSEATTSSPPVLVHSDSATGARRAIARASLRQADDRSCSYVIRPHSAGLVQFVATHGSNAQRLCGGGYSSRHAQAPRSLSPAVCPGSFPKLLRGHAP